MGQHCYSRTPVAGLLSSQWFADCYYNKMWHSRKHGPVPTFFAAIKCLIYFFKIINFKHFLWFLCSIVDKIRIYEICKLLPLILEVFFRFYTVFHFSQKLLACLWMKLLPFRVKLQIKETICPCFTGELPFISFCFLQYYQKYKGSLQPLPMVKREFI